MKFISLRSPQYNIGTGATTDEPVFINTNQISEILPKEYATRRGDTDGWNTLIVMTTGNEYKVIEDAQHILKLIAD